MKKELLIEEIKSLLNKRIGIKYPDVEDGYSSAIFDVIDLINKLPLDIP